MFPPSGNRVRSDSTIQNKQSNTVHFENVDVSLKAIPALAFGSTKSINKLTQGNIRDLGFGRDSTTIQQVAHTASCNRYELWKMNASFDPITHMCIGGARYVLFCVRFTVIDLTNPH